MTSPLNRLVERLRRIGITVDLIGNVPWIYLNSVNGNYVRDKYKANHGFTIAFLQGDGSVKLTDTKVIFDVIRKNRFESAQIDDEDDLRDQ